MHKQITLIFQVKGYKFAIPQELVTEVIPFSSENHSIIHENNQSTLKIEDETIPIAPLPHNIALQSFPHNYILLMTAGSKKCLIVDIIVGVEEMDKEFGDNMLLEMEEVATSNEDIAENSAGEVEKQDDNKQLSRRLLLIDPNSLMRKLLAQTIKQYEYQVDEAANFEVAKDILNDNQDYHAILIAAQVINEDITNLMHFIKQHECHKNCLLIGLSNESNRNDNSQFDKYVSKMQYSQLMKIL
jgi:CheY-like chemotaxis protein